MPVVVLTSRVDSKVVERLDEAARWVRESGEDPDATRSSLIREFLEVGLAVVEGRITRPIGPGEEAP